MPCLHCSPPTSDPRAPEQREQHSLLTDIKQTPGASSDSPKIDGRPPGSSPKPPKSHRRQPRPSPKIREPRHPRSRHSPHDCPGAQATTERRTLAEEPDERSSPRQPSRERPAEGQPATRQRRPHHLRPQQRPYTILRSTGRAQYSVETPPRAARLSEPLVGLRPPQAGPSSTALDGVCVDAPTPPGNTFCTKGGSGTCSACKGHRPCIKAGATKRALLAPGILSALLHQQANAHRLQRGTSSRQVQLQPNSPL